MNPPAKDHKKEEKLKVKKEKPSIFIRFIVTLLLMLGVFIVAAVITYVATIFAPSKKAVTYNDCTHTKGSIIQPTYPAICTTRNGQRFIQPLSPEEQKLLDSQVDQTN